MRMKKAIDTVSKMARLAEGCEIPVIMIIAVVSLFKK